MEDYFYLLGAIGLCFSFVLGLIWWSRRGQRKIAKEIEAGWDEAGRNH
jgi:hypothetical protein